LEPEDPEAISDIPESTEMPWLKFEERAKFVVTEGTCALASEPMPMTELYRDRLKAPPIGSVANMGLFYYGRKDRARRIPQEKGIPRRIELRHIDRSSIQDTLSVAPKP
jgi:hypothetical protein